MAFCTKCGSNLPEGAQFCTSCGAPAFDSAQKTAVNDVSQNKVFAILAYLGILVLVPIFAAKDSKFARFHANQGLILVICSVAYGIAYGILSAILFSIFPWYLWKIPSLICTLLSLASLVFLAAAIVGIVNAAQGQEKELPFIGKYRILK